MRRKGGRALRYKFNRHQRKLNPRQKVQVKRLIGNRIERKFDISSFAATVVVAGTLNDHFTPAQGDSDGNRSGDEARLSSCHFKLQLLKDPASVSAFEFVRLIFFQWKPSTQFVSPTVASILLTDATTGAVSYRSHYQVDTKDMFHILYDRTFHMTGATATTLGDSCAQFHRGIVPLKKARKNVQFYNGGINGSGKIFSLLISATTTTPVQYNLNTQTWYSDS